MDGYNFINYGFDGHWQQQLANLARIKSYMTISDYEKGKVKITKPMGLLFEILLT